MQLAQLGITNTFPKRGGPPEPVEPPTPEQYLFLKLDTHNTTAFFQERAIYPSGVPITPADANTEPIGTALSMDVHMMYVFCPSATAGHRPTLSSDANRNSFFAFSGASQRLQVNNSVEYFKFLHATSPVWSLQFYILKGLDGAARAVFSNSGGSTAQAGLYIDVTAANKIRVLLTYASAGNSIVNYTTTTSLTVASGWTPVQIVINGSGVGTGSITIGSTTETFNVGATGTTANPPTSLNIGSDNSASHFQGGLSDIRIYTRVLSGSEITAYQSYNPARSTSYFTPIKQWDFDFNDSTTLFADLAETTPITDGTALRSVRNKVQTYSSAIVRKATSAAAGSSPIWRQAVKNGKSVIEFDGVDDNLDLSADMMPEVGGIWTMFVYAKNDDATNGSHFGSGANYWGRTGQNYAPGEFPDPYHFLHMLGGDALAGEAAYTDDRYEMVAIRRIGTTMAFFDSQGVKVEESGKDDAFNITDLGNFLITSSDWQWDGFCGMYRKYVGAFTDSEIQAYLAYLNYYYGD